MKVEEWRKGEVSIHLVYIGHRRRDLPEELPAAKVSGWCSEMHQHQHQHHHAGTSTSTTSSTTTSTNTSTRPALRLGQFVPLHDIVEQLPAWREDRPSPFHQT